MMRGKTQGKNLACQLTVDFIILEKLPYFLCTSCCMVNFATPLVGNVLGDVILKRIAVFAEIMQQTDKPACVFCAYFFGKFGAFCGSFLQVFENRLFCFVGGAAAGYTEAVCRHDFFTGGGRSSLKISCCNSPVEYFLSLLSSGKYNGGGNS